MHLIYLTRDSWSRYVEMSNFVQIKGIREKALLDNVSDSFWSCCINGHIRTDFKTQ